jgi:hypothetical protein
MIQPRRWKKDVQLKNLQKRLEVYGGLVVILKSCREKAKRQRKEGQKETHLMENPYDYKKLARIFERYGYLLSDDVSKLWLDFMTADTYFAVYNSLKKGSGLLSHDFSVLEKSAEAEYEKLKVQYRGLTGITLQERGERL